MRPWKRRLSDDERSVLGLPVAADDLARIVYAKVKPLHPSLPSLADECPEWKWYEES